MQRRDLIRSGLLAGAASVIPGALNGSPATNGRTAASRGRARARNVIFYAYDGLTWEDVAMAQHYARRHLDRPLLLSGLFAGGRGGSMETYSLTSMVTDSAAASSAWSTGRKTVNYMVNVYPDGTPLTTIMELARARGLATGLITTTRITHATPAAWIAKVANRNMEDEIAAQYLAFRPDVLLGGGARHFSATRRADRRDMAAEFAGAGYGVVRTREALLRNNASRVLGIFHDDHIPFEIDRRFQHAAAPSLAELTRAGLEILDGYESGFVAQVEAGRIDHANHKNDAAASLWDVLAADEALAVILAYVARRPDTLLIMASDHATGGGAVYGYGTAYLASSRAFERLLPHRASFDHILAGLGARPAAAEIRDVVRRYTGITLTGRQLDIARAAIVDGVRAPNHVAFVDQPHDTLGFVLYGGGDGAQRDRANVNFATGQHTAGAVPAAIHGAGAELREIGLIDNTELFGWLCDAIGVRHDNPVMTEPEALEIMARRSGTAREEAAARG